MEKSCINCERFKSMRVLCEHNKKLQCLGAIEDNFSHRYFIPKKEKD